MFDRFTDRARQAMGFAHEEAARFGRKHLGCEHLLLGLIRERHGVAARALDRLRVTEDALRGAIEKIDPGAAAIAFSAVATFTPHLKVALELAAAEAKRTGNGYAGTEHLLIGIVRSSEESAAVLALAVLDHSADEVYFAVTEELGMDVRHANRAFSQLKRRVERLEPRAPRNTVAQDAAAVRALCEAAGYGFVMHEAAKAWAEVGSAPLAIGPAAPFTRHCGCERPGDCGRCHGCGWQFRE